MENNHLGFLFAAYSVVWLILGFYIFILIMRNRRLNRQMEDLESRMHQLEKGQQ